MKVTSGSLAEQLVVWLTSEGKTSVFSAFSILKRSAETMSSLSAPNCFTLMQTFPTCYKTFVLKFKGDSL